MNVSLSHLADQDQHPHIQLIKWPGNSPDLNPIENVWAWMKVQLRESTVCNLKNI
jgi:transposase